MVRGHRSGDHDGIDRVVGEDILEGAGHARLRVARPVLRLPLLVGVADPCEVGELAHDSRDVPSPAADARVGDAGQSFQTLSLVTPARPVAFRRSTTSCASATSFA